MLVLIHPSKQRPTTLKLYGICFGEVSPTNYEGQGRHV
jgi:hypothetical protein